MSAVASGAPAAVPTKTRRHRPSTWTVWRWELRKLIAQKRTYMGLFLASILPIIFVIVEHVHQHGDHGRDNIFATQITQSGLATPVLMLFFLSQFMLHLVAALVAGDIVANEDSNGTLKTILTRSVDRGQIFAAKAFAAMAYSATALFLSALVATVAGVASWGFHPIISYSGTVGFVIVLFIIAQVPGLEGIHPYLLTQQFQNWQGLLRTPTDWSPIAHSAWVCALYALPALFAAYLVFLRRDVAGG